MCLSFLIAYFFFVIEFDVEDVFDLLKPVSCRCPSSFFSLHSFLEQIERAK